jgi:two-component system chemotaxis response regulator CheY
MARILIVDDEEMDRVLERTILEKAGHELLYAGDGHVALAVCRETDIELVITDLAMPEFNGLRFIKELREEGFRMPIIAISGWAKDQLDLAESYGADLTLFKPIDGDALLEGVQNMLRLPDVSDRADPWKRGRGK